MRKKLKDKFYSKSDLGNTDWYQSLIGDEPDYIDVYSIIDGYVKMDLSKILVPLDAGTRTTILDECVERLKRETIHSVRYEGNNLIIDFDNTNVAEVDEYDLAGDFAVQNTTIASDMYSELKDETNIMRKKLYATLKFAQNPTFSCELVKEPTEFQEGEIYGDFEQSVEFKEDGENFAKSEIADRMWHVVYHVLKDYDMIELIANDDEDAEEMIESNVIAGKLGLFTGELVINEIGIYWEKTFE